MGFRERTREALAAELAGNACCETCTEKELDRSLQALCPRLSTQAQCVLAKVRLITFESAKTLRFPP